MIGRMSKHAAIYSASQGGVTPFRPIVEGDFVYSGSYSISPYGELYLTSSGNLQFSQTYNDSYFDFCIVSGGGGGGNSSATTGSSNRSQTGGGGGGGAVRNIFKYRDPDEERSAIGYAPSFIVSVGAGGARASNGEPSILYNDYESFYVYGGYLGVDGSASSKKSGNGGRGGYWYDSSTQQNVQGGSGGGGGSYGPNQIGGAGGTNGSNGVNGTTNNASAGTPGNGGLGGGIDCHCFQEEWNTLFGSGGQGGSGNVSQAGANGANYRGNGGGGASTTYNNTGVTRGGSGGSGVVVVRFHCSPRPEPPVGLLGGFNLFSEE